MDKTETKQTQKLVTHGTDQFASPFTIKQLFFLVVFFAAVKRTDRITRELDTRAKAACFTLHWLTFLSGG